MMQGSKSAEVNAPAKPRLVIVGAGMAGLTAGAYLARAGWKPLILEKSSGVGGLVSSYWKEGFLVDTGPRAMGNAGILIPMLEDLGLELPLEKGEVSTGITDQIVHYDRLEDLEEFIHSLEILFPREKRAVSRIGRLLRRYTRMAEILNRVANPFFKNPLKDPSFLLTAFIPWLPSFFSVVMRTAWGVPSMEKALGRITKNQALIDMVSQHFFKGTPAPFALGYFANFQDYLYPRGGTAQLPRRLAAFITDQGGTILTGKEITSLDPAARLLADQEGTEYPYDLLLWGANLKALYRRMQPRNLSARRRRALAREESRYEAVECGESVFSLFLGVDEPPETFQKISRGHFIYTPRIEGLGSRHREDLEKLKVELNNPSPSTREKLFAWLEGFCRFNSYEISLPVLKDAALAPEGKTGILVSFLMDGMLWERVAEAGWLKEFRERTAELMLDALEGSIYPGLRKKILLQQSVTPLTLKRMFQSEEGAITGWSLEEKPPVPHSLAEIMGSPATADPHIFKAGQWSYSPSGVPIALLTGRIAASAMEKGARRLEKGLQKKKNQ